MNHYPGKIYFLKSNLQRQEGNLITKDIDFILNNAWDKNFVVAQDLMQNPFTVDGHKINLRVYLLIVIRKNLCDFYIYNDGFVYYAKKKFEPNSIDREVNITSGFGDRSIYEDHPLTTQDLYKHIGPDIASKMQHNIEQAFSEIYKVYKQDFIDKNINVPGISFNLYGVDIAPGADLSVTVLEANKGPSIDKKSERDGDLNYAMSRDLFGVVSIISGKDVHPDNWIQIK